MSSTENWKQLGNDSFKNSDFSAAIGFYSKAIEADPSDPKPLVNRSIARASLLQWKESAFDARKAIQIDPKYTKAHFRFVRALLAMNKVKDARFALSMAFKECGEQTKDFKDLEEEIFNLTGIPLRPKSTDFEVIGELGDGNFSKVYKTFLKATKQVFAIKAIERVVIDKMKRRHPNIQNEILMEKRVLHKLNHPGVATLYCTFQDAGTLYYMNEYIGGGDLWTNLHEIIYDKSSQENTNLQKSLNLSETELFDAQSVRKGVTGAQVGVHWSLLSFYFTQMLSAVEHMHQHGIVHRDIKPENIMITEQGYLKFVDFGTAKDFLEPNLNGPEFVGTPEYMCPGTVKVKRDAYVGIEADLWALGATLFQMVLGSTPFNAPSPFLTFLRIKRGKVEIPCWVPSNIAALIRLLLTKDAVSRVAFAAGDTAPAWIIGASHKSATAAVDATNNYAQELKRLSYNALRHSCEDFFVADKFNAAVFQPNVQFYRSILGHNANYVSSSPDAIIAEDVQKESLDDDNDDDDEDNKESVDAVYANMVAVDVRVVAGDETHGWKTSTTFRPMSSLSSSQESTKPSLHVHRVLPRLHDICIRAVGEAAVTVAFAVAENGGVRPSHIPWMQRFALSSGGRVSERDRQRIMHFLTRKQKLQIPSVYRLFFQNLPDSRCLRANPDTLEYVGFNRTIQGHYNQPFHFAYIAGPQLGQSHHSFARAGNAHATEITTEEETQEKLLRLSIAQLNKLRPKFIVMAGPFVSHSLYHDRSASEEDKNALAKLYWSKFRRLVARVSDTMSVLFVPSPLDLAYLPTETTHKRITAASMWHYRQHYGADYYGFWFEGMRGLVLNSSLLVMHPEETDEKDVHFFQAEQARQLQWLEEEIEQCKLCATSLVLFAYHPWYRQSLEEEDDLPGSSSSSSDPAAVVPKQIRVKILTWLRHHKVRYVFAGVSRGKDNNTVVKPFAKQTSQKGVAAVEDVTLGEDKEETANDNDSDKDTSSDDDKDEKEENNNNNNKDDEDDEVYVNEDEQYEGPEMLFSAEPVSDMNEEMMVRMVYVQEYESVHQDYLFQAASVSNPSTPVSHIDDCGVHQKKHLPATMQALVSDLQSLLTQPVATKK